MCGRYVLTSDAGAIARAFGCEVGVKLQPRYNIAPTQPTPVIRIRKDTGARRLAMVHWGLIPAWAQDPTIGSRMINARSETAVEKPAFRHAMKYRRCLVPCDGFYEWQKLADGSKQPHLIRMADEQPFAMAGLWERWQDEHGNEMDSCTILTTDANEMMAKLHQRMPVILLPEDYDDWLDPAQQNAQAAAAKLKPYPAAKMMHFPVSPFVNNPRHEDARCIEPTPA